MGNYTYKCDNKECPNNSDFTVWQNIKDDPLQNCPECACKVNRVYVTGNVNLMFSGSYNSTRGR